MTLLLSKKTLEKVAMHQELMMKLLKGTEVAVDTDAQLIHEVDAVWHYQGLALWLGFFRASVSIFQD